MSAKCEAITAVFSYGPMRCGAPASGEAIDATWGTIHPVCDDHAPADERPITDVFREQAGRIATALELCEELEASPVRGVRYIGAEFRRALTGEATR